MKVGDTVFVFTSSGSFKGDRGEVVRTARGGAMVRVDGEPRPLLFTNREIVQEHPSTHHVGGAE